MQVRTYQLAITQGDFGLVIDEQMTNILNGILDAGHTIHQDEVIVRTLGEGHVKYYYRVRSSPPQEQEPMGPATFQPSTRPPLT